MTENPQDTFSKAKIWVGRGVFGGIALGVMLIVVFAFFPIIRFFVLVLPPWAIIVDVVLSLASFAGLDWAVSRWLFKRPPWWMRVKAWWDDPWKKQSWEG